MIFDTTEKKQFLALAFLSSFLCDSSSEPPLDLKVVQGHHSFLLLPPKDPMLQDEWSFFQPIIRV